VGGIEAALAEHAFEHLFIECLGWDRARSRVSIELQGVKFEIAAVAQKRGFTVFLCPTDRTVLANRALLRKIQQLLRKAHHEHILIHHCPTPRKQVWQWATMIGEQRQILHREHPFFSDDPPPRLLERVRGLEVSFQQEDETMLVDVLHRVRTALLPDSEFNLFARYPKYAEQSDRLAMAMRRGESGAFSAFVELHMPLAKHASRMLVRWFGMDVDDAEQTAMIGLIEATRRFDPERGFQFSTYAGYWLRQACQRYGLLWGLPIRMPPHLFWPCYRLTFTRIKLIATHGECEKVESQFEQELAAAGISRETWDTFCAARHMGFFSDLSQRDLAGWGFRKSH
jgi:RNA polymerase sigma factor (sigma-70 family)